MIITTPFSLSNMVKTFTLGAIILTLTACGTVPIQPAKTLPQNQSESKIDSQPSTAFTKRLSLEELKTLRATAAEQNDWPNYLIYSTQLWYKSSNEPSYQSQITQQAWLILNSLPEKALKTIDDSQTPEVQAWATLLNGFKGGMTHFGNAILNLKTFESDAIYQKHLLPRLLAQQPQTLPVKQIAVLLPFTGKYKFVSQQIRNGIMKAFFASDQTIKLKFYDSSDLENLENIYTLAKQDGADRIIGPLRKEAIQELARFQDKNLLALNNIEGTAFTKFSLKSANPDIQMLTKFQQLGYHRIGILTNDAKRSFNHAKLLEQTLKQAGFRAEVSVYPNNHPRLREALGLLIHEEQSNARKNNLRWLLGEKLHFFPRTRQDLDAIVIFDDAARMAVFRPQFDFYELNIPVFGSTDLTPDHFQEIPRNRDLNRVSFLTYPAVLSPENLDSKFEAYGWDSFQITLHAESLHNDACLTNAKTGILSLENGEIKQTLIWAKYDSKGVLQEAPITALAEPAAVVEASARNSDSDE